MSGPKLPRKTKPSRYALHCRVAIDDRDDREGKLEVRRGITVIAGRFLFFGANLIARGSSETWTAARRV